MIRMIAMTGLPLFFSILRVGDIYMHVVGLLFFRSSFFKSVSCLGQRERS